MTKPAFFIALTAQQKRLIAEISAIQSQIEWLMRTTMQHLLKVSPKTAAIIMGSTNIGVNAHIWISVIRDLCQTDDELCAWAEYGYKQIEKTSKARNNFMHTLYGYDAETHPYLENVFFVHAHTHKPKKYGVPYAPQKAIKLKTSTKVPLESLKDTRDEAAKLSLVFAHVQHLASPYSIIEPSPWLRRLGSRLPPQSPKEGRKKGKGRQVQHPPSQK